MTKVCFCGISGSGMSALAQILKSRGYDVCGSDRSFDLGKDEPSKTALQSVGIKIFPQDGSCICDDTSCLYVSSAVEDSISDVQKALAKKIPIKKRSDLLAEIFNDYTYGIAVGGTSGKTTVTAMIGFILDRAGKKPLVINGGLLKNYLDQKGIANVVLNHGDTCVVEADESDGSIEKYLPYVSVINNISIDHKTIDELQKLFSDFARKAKGGVVINLDCACCAPLLKCHPKTVTFSIADPSADVFLDNVEPLPDGVSYTLNGQLFRLRIPGAFNVGNAAAAMAACSLLGVDTILSAQILEDFLGTKRRLDVIGKHNNITIIDDFAHNPDKVLASMSALRDYEGRLLVMFQPHGFAPMRLMGKEIMDSYVQTMTSQDQLFLPEIYYAGGSVNRNISSKDLVDYARSKGVNAHFYQKREDIKRQILKIARSGDRIVVMGARDNSLPEFCQELLEEISRVETRG